MKLTEPQIQAFHEKGYHIFGRLLTEAQVDRMAQVYLDCLANYRSDHPTRKVSNVRHRAGRCGKQSEFVKMRCAHLMHPGFDEIMREAHLLDAVESLIGPNIRIIVCQGLYKPPHTDDEVRWHQDNHYFQVDNPNAVVSCWITFDDATINSGCMWVSPGGHRGTFDHEVDQDSGSSYIPDVAEAGAVAIELNHGECMLHHGLMPHRTLGNTTSFHRRALAIHYMDAAARPSESRQQEPPENMPVVRGEGIHWS